MHVQLSMEEHTKNAQNNSICKLLWRWGKWKNSLLSLFSLSVNFTCKSDCYYIPWFFHVWRECGGDPSLYDDGTLKWKSHDMTNANTMQASSKFKKRWPCQKFRVSEGNVGVAGMADGAGGMSISLVGCSADSTSLTPAMFRAMELQISQVLESQGDQNKSNQRRSENRGESMSCMVLESTLCRWL